MCICKNEYKTAAFEKRPRQRRLFIASFFSPDPTVGICKPIFLLMFLSAAFLKEGARYCTYNNLFLARTEYWWTMVNSCLHTAKHIPEPVHCTVYTIQYVDTVSALSMANIPHAITSLKNTHMRWLWLCRMTMVFPLYPVNYVQWH